MSMRPSWLPTVAVLDVLTYAVPLPACICAPVPYGLPVTCVAEHEAVVVARDAA